MAEQITVTLTENGTLKVVIETAAIDHRKHGKGYVRRMFPEPTFIDPVHVEWGKRTQTQYYAFIAQPGELFQARLWDGSWNNDSKRYFRVIGEQWVEVDSAEAGREIAARNVDAI